MKSIILAVLVFLLSMTICAGVSHAFDSEVDCVGVSVAVETENEVKNALNGINESDLKGESYVICFQSDDIPGVISTLEIKGKDKPLIVHGLSLLPGKVFGGEDYSGLIVRVLGNDVTLIDTNIEKATTALEILEATNFKLIDSTINAKESAVIVDDSSDVTIESSKLVGDGTPDSKAVFVKNGHDVKVKDNPEGISGFDYGVYVMFGSKINLSNTTFTISDPLKAMFWETDGEMIVDTNLIGKKLDNSGKVVTRIAGKAPACEGKVDLYIYDSKVAESGTSIPQITYETSSDIVQLSNNDNLCLLKHDESYEYIDKESCIEDGKCICIEDDKCVYDFSSLDLNPDDEAIFVYADSAGNTYPMSLPKKIGLLDDIISSIPSPVPYDIPTPTGVTDGGEEVEGVSGSGGESGLDSGVGGGASMMSGMSRCSLAIDAMDFSAIYALGFMISILVVTRLAVHRSQNHMQ